MKVNYQGVRGAIAGRQAFKGNSCRAVKTKEDYTIYSYATAIYKIDYTKQAIDFFNLNFYSVTTSKLQGIIAEVIFGKSLKELRKAEEKEVLK